MNKISHMTGCLYFLSKYYEPSSHTGTQRLDEMLPNVYITTNETLVNIPPKPSSATCRWANFPGSPVYLNEKEMNIKFVEMKLSITHNCD